MILKIRVLAITLCLISCNNNIDVKNQESKLNSQKFIFLTYDFCSEELLLNDNIFGNMILERTPNNNFLKCTIQDDSIYMFSCGRKNKEIFISEIKCRSSFTNLSFDGKIFPKLLYDDDDIIILYQTGGSDSWINYFINFSNNTIYKEQAIYIDEENRKYVYLDNNDYKNNNVFFVIHDIMSNERDSLRLNYYSYREDGYPSQFIKNVFLKDNYLYYSVKVKRRLVENKIKYE